MRKTYLFIIALLGIVVLFGACNKRDTYADKLKKERKAISRFIDEYDLDILYEYPENGVFAENEYFRDENTGVYFRVDYPGSGDTIKIANRNRISLRFDTLNVFLVVNDTIWGNDVMNSFDYPILVTYGNESTYTFDSSSDNTYGYYFKSAGCMLPLKYGIRDKGRVSVLIPFSSGSSYQQSPNYYPLFVEKLTYYVVD